MLIFIYLVLIGKMQRFVYIFLVFIVCGCSTHNQEVKLNLKLRKGDFYNSILAIESKKEHTKGSFSLVMDYNLKCLEQNDSSYIVHLTLNKMDLDMSGMKNDIHYNSDYPADARGVKPGFFQMLLALKDQGLKCILDNNGRVLNILNKKELLKDNVEMSMMINSTDFLDSKGFLPDTMLVLNKSMDVQLMEGNTEYSKAILSNWNESQYNLKTEAKLTKKMVIGEVVYEFVTNSFINKANHFPEKIVSDVNFSIGEEKYAFKITNVSKRI